MIKTKKVLQYDEVVIINRATHPVPFFTSGSCLIANLQRRDLEPRTYSVVDIEKKNLHLHTFVYFAVVFLHNVSLKALWYTRKKHSNTVATTTFAITSSYCLKTQKHDQCSPTPTTAAIERLQKLRP